MKKKLDIKNRRVHVLLVVVLAIVIYSNTFNVPFIFDDFLYIANNDIVKDLRHFIEPSKTVNALSPDTLVNYTFRSRFIGYLTFAINHKLSGMDVRGYHILNLIIHIFNALLVYCLVMLTLTLTLRIHDTRYKMPDMEKIRDTGYTIHDKKHASCIVHHESGQADSPIYLFTYLPLFIALIFVCHPVQTQAVTYISQRFASLATFFYLLSLVMYIKFRIHDSRFTIHDKENHESCIMNRESCIVSRASWILYLASLLSAVLAMETKEIAFTLPIMISLYEFMFFTDSRFTIHGSRFKRRILYLMPILLTMLIVPMAIIDTTKPVGDLISGVDEATRAKAVISRLDYLFTEFRVIVTYIRLFFSPFNQNFDYDYPVYNSFLSPEVLLSFLFLLSIFGFGIYLFYRSRFTIHDARYTIHNTPSMNYVSRVTHHALRLVAFGIFWFFITLSVESSIIPTQDMIYEHRLYLPSVGIIMAFGTALFGVIQRRGGSATVRQNDRTSGQSSSFSFLSIALPLYCSVALIVLLSIASYTRNTVWQDDVVLWKDAIKKSPQKPRAYHELGLAYSNKGMLNEAISEFENTVRLKPDYMMAHNNLGVIYFKKEMYDEAIREIQITLMLGGTKNADAYGNIGAIYLKKELTERAIEYLQYALTIDPGYASAHHNLGIAYERKGMTDKAREHFEKAHMLNPDKYP